MGVQSKKTIVQKNKKLGIKTCATTCTGKIPKNMHFIWVGNNQIPATYIQYIQ